MPSSVHLFIMIKWPKSQEKEYSLTNLVCHYWFHRVVHHLPTPEQRINLGFHQGLPLNNLRNEYSHDLQVLVFFIRNQ